MRGFGYYGNGAARAMPWLGWIAPIAMIVFWALVVTALVLFIRFFIRQSRARIRDDSAIEVLKVRYAKGEINKEEFEEKHKDLSR